MEVTARWNRTATLYRRFANDWAHLVDFSRDMAVEMFVHESSGGPVSERNGYALGKKWMDVTVSMWREDIARGLLNRAELEADGFPEWWLNKVLR